MIHKDRKRQKIFYWRSFYQLSAYSLPRIDLAQAVHNAERFPCEKKPHMNEKRKDHTKKTKFRLDKQYKLET